MNNDIIYTRLYDVYILYLVQLYIKNDHTYILLLLY